MTGARAAQAAQPERSQLEAVIDAVRAELHALPAAAGRGAVLVLSGPMQPRVDGRFAAFLTPGRLEPFTVHNLPVVNRAGQAKDLGVDLLVELYQRRWTQAALGDPLVPDDLIRAAARWSSGIVREFLTLVRDTGKAALRGGRKPAVEDDLQLAIGERRHTMEITLDATRWDVLAEVLVVPDLELWAQASE